MGDMLKMLEVGDKADTLSALKDRLSLCSWWLCFRLWPRLMRDVKLFNLLGGNVGVGTQALGKDSLMVRDIFNLTGQTRTGLKFN